MHEENNEVSKDTLTKKQLSEKLHTKKDSAKNELKQHAEHMKALPGSVHFNIKKSLSNRIRFIVNMSTLLTVILLGLIYAVLANKAINTIESALSSYYAEEIQQTLQRVEAQIASTKGTVASDGTSVQSELNSESIKTNRMFIDKMQTLTHVVPILSVDLYIDDRLTYQLDAKNLLISYFQNSTVVSESTDALETAQTLDELSQLNDMKMHTVTKDMLNLGGEKIGYAVIGIDFRILIFIYTVILMPIIFGSLLVLVIMKILTGFITKPILNPLKKLKNQLELLADENYENINPSIEIGKRSVVEVVDISLATNKLLNKMIKYNEVITQSEKMASIGQLTAAITHEINTPLGVINANAGLMQMITTEILTITDEEERQLMINSMAETASTTEEACLRIQEIIKSLRSYSRIDQADFMPASINDSIHGVITLTTNLHKNRIRIVEHLSDIPDVSCYIGLINQVFMNIMINAIQAIEKEGTITFETTADEEFVYAKISDTGCGIDKKNFYRVFEYGFTTKQPGSGSGIGLALSKNIMMKHNGEILIDSEIGVGTTITIKLPIKQNIEVK